MTFSNTGKTTSEVISSLTDALAGDMQAAFDRGKAVAKSDIAYINAELNAKTQELDTMKEKLKQTAHARDDANAKVWDLKHNTMANDSLVAKLNEAERARDKAQAYNVTLAKKLGVAKRETKDAKASSRANNGGWVRCEKMFRDERGVTTALKNQKAELEAAIKRAQDGEFNALADKKYLDGELNQAVFDVIAARKERDEAKKDAAFANAGWDKAVIGKAALVEKNERLRNAKVLEFGDSTLLPTGEWENINRKLRSRTEDLNSYKGLYQEHRATINALKAQLSAANTLVNKAYGQSFNQKYPTLSNAIDDLSDAVDNLDHYKTFDSAAKVIRARESIR